MSQANETVFTWGAPPLKFGAGALDEVGYDISTHGARRVLVVTDPGVAHLGIADRVVASLRRYGIETEVFEHSHVEPTDKSMNEAVDFAKDKGPFDGYVAVGGGSSIDTAKAVNLLLTDGGELTEYLNKPVGDGRAPSGPLMPLIAVPTTAGTGSESTGTCVMDVLSLRVKTGIGHWRLRPTMAVIDPTVTLSLPAGVTASSGMDIVCHALESFTARPFEDYPAKKAEERVPYCGSNPVADLWCEKALSLIARSFRTAVRDGANVDARSDMMLAATCAGMGFGNAGVHIPHANAYPIAGMVKDFHPVDYPQDEAMVPHGMSVSLTAPAAFRFTFSSAPERHVQAALMLQPDLDSDIPDEEKLPTALINLMRDIGIPNGISGVGFEASDIPELVPGTMKQQRLLSISPREVTEDDIAAIFEESLSNW